MMPALFPRVIQGGILYKLSCLFVHMFYSSVI